MLAAKVLLLLLISVIAIDAAKPAPKQPNPPPKGGKGKAPTATVAPAKAKGKAPPTPAPGAKKKPGLGRSLDGEPGDGATKAPGASGRGGSDTWAPEGFQLLGEGQDSKRYYISSEKKTRAEAIETCRDFSKNSPLFANTLVVGNDPSVQGHVGQLLSTQADVNCAWTGNFFRTIDGQKRMFIPGVNDSMSSSTEVSTGSRRKRQAVHRQTKRQARGSSEEGYGETYPFTLVQEIHFPYFDNWDESKTGGCEPTCPPFNCTVTAPICNTTVPPCRQIESPSCQMVNSAPLTVETCVADCTDCEMTQPNCTVIQDPCSVRPRKCEVTAGNCTFKSPVCTDSPRKCYTEQPPCEVKPPPHDDASVCTAPQCYNIPIKSIVHCRTNKDRPECNTIPSVCLSPKFCAAPEIICPAPMTICLPPTIKCTPREMTCDEPNLHCTLPEVYCPPPRVHCTQPVVRCQPPVVKCPRETIKCSPPKLACPIPITHCNDPIVKCTPPPPCKFEPLPEREACPPPPTLVECKGEECLCGRLTKGSQWGLEEVTCSEQCNVVCEAT